MLVLLYAAVLRRRVALGGYAFLAIAGLASSGLLLGSVSAGESGVGAVAGIALGVLAVVAIGVTVRRRRRGVKTVFLSYRRADSAAITERVAHALCTEFGPENVFRDLTSVELGDRFREVVIDAVNHSDAFIAVIGTQWLDVTGSRGQRRIDDPNDLVRVEVETALSNGRVLVVPLAVNGAALPQPGELPASIAALASRNGGVVREGPSFAADVARLIDGLRRGSVAPWSRSADARVSWGRVGLAVAVLVVPLLGIFLDYSAQRYRRFSAAAFSAPNQLLATDAFGRAAGHVRLWDASSGRLVRELPTAARRAPSEIRWSPDGRYIATVGRDGAIEVLAADDSRSVARFDDTIDRRPSLAWAGDSERLGCVDDYGTIRVFGVGARVLLTTAHVHSAGIRAFAWSPGGELLATGSWDRTAKISDPRSGAVLAELRTHESLVNAVAWSRDGNQVATAAVEVPFVVVWDRRRPDDVRELSGHQRQVEALAWSPGADLLATAGADDSVRVWGAAGNVVHVFPHESHGAAAIAWSPDGELLAVAGKSDVAIWQARTGRRVAQWRAHPGDYRSEILSWWKGSERVVTRGAREGTVRIWNAANGSLLQTIRTGEVRAFADMFL